jgi:predicted TIM-barrel fold metal-dependent hydrolase
VHKRHEGADEEIVEPDIPIIDAHHHLFDRPGGRYLLDDYLADVGLGHNIVASVYVETLAMARVDGPELLRPIGEVEFANGTAAVSASGRYGPCRVAAAIVGYADLRAGARVGGLLDRSLATSPDRFRGVRQLAMDATDRSFRRFITNPPPAGLLDDPYFRTGLRELVRRGLSFDAAVFDHQLIQLAEIADALPELSIVLNHLGLGFMLDLDEPSRAEAFTRWREGMRAIAARPNVTCKVGGLGQAFWNFGFDARADAVSYLELSAAWAPFVETGIELFGVDRCLMESNFPADGRSCGFVPCWNALKHIVRGASAAEKAALFHETSARVYRI